MNRYDHVIWDWNGTIIDDAYLCVEVMNQVLKNKDLPLINIGSYRKNFCFPVKKYYEILGFNFTIDSFETSGLEFVDLYLPRRYEAPLFPKVRKTIELLLAHGITHSILSAQNEETLCDVAKHYNMSKYFINIVGLNNRYAHGKINAGISLINKLHYKKSKIIIIGDTKHDAEVASKLGIDSLLLSCGHNDKSQLAQTPSSIIDCHDEILEHIII